MQLGGRHLAHTEQFFHWQGFNKFRHLLRRNDEQAVWLAPVTGNLGQELVRGHAGGDGNTYLLADPLPQVSGHQGGAATVIRYVRHIQEGFIQRQGFHQIGHFPENGHYLLRRGPVSGHIRWHGHQPWAQPAGFTAGHGGAHTKGPCPVVARRHHAPALGAANCQGHVPQRWVVAHLDRRIEAVAIHMNDLALGHGPWARVNNLYIYTALYLKLTCRECQEP